MDDGAPGGAWRRRGPILCAGAVVVTATLLYAPALRAGFYSDDYTWLGRMAATRANPLYLFSIFFRDFNPLLHLSFLLDDSLGGGSAWPFHATSILVHAACALLLMLLCRRLGAGPAVAAAAALTWAVNVRLSEAVIWPAARGHSLATLFVLAALVLLAGTWRLKVWAGTACLALALLSKETALFPFVLTPLFFGDTRPRAADLAPIGLLGGGFAIFNYVAKPSFHFAGGGAADLLLKTPFILLRPLGLGDAYDFSALGFTVSITLLAGAAFLLRRTVARAGFLWLLVCLVPILPLQKLSSRYLYLLSIGYAFILCGVLEAARARLPGREARRLALPLALAALALGVTTNVILIRREIDDYALMAKPYAACLEALRGPAERLEPGETLVVVDASPRDAVAALGRSIWERGNMVKLIPYRARAVEGLVMLQDAVNIARRGRGGLFGAAGPGPTVESLRGPERAATRRRIVVYDGRRATEAAEAPPATADRLFAARLADFAEYRAAEIAADE